MFNSTFPARVSESENRAEADAEVVVGAVVEIDLVAEFEAQTQRAESWFDSACGVERELQIRRAKSDERTC